MTLGIPTEREVQKFAATSRGFRIDQDKQKDYAIMLDAKLNAMAITPTWEALRKAVLETAMQVFG